MGLAAMGLAATTLCRFGCEEGVAKWALCEVTRLFAGIEEARKVELCEDFAR